ncbi:hypothetical protein [Rickettsia endosymbiont of Orchestes rusci]|uniref:hypothetical protein n=1 Tax=Rickettsia endosymbiont of Orchestes rusci TaxID=3066250 RepID=UPI00313D4CE5
MSFPRRRESIIRHGSPLQAAWQSRKIIIFIAFFAIFSRIAARLAAAALLHGSNFRCHSRENGNPEKLN